MLIFILILFFFLFGVFWYFEVIWRYRLEDLSYLDSVYSKKDRVESKDKIYISLTTIPDRIYGISKTLQVLLSQSKRVDKIYLNLPYTTLKGQSYCIPEYLESLTHVKIHRFNNDFGPSSKLLPMLSKDALIIVIDDDILYGSKLVETLTSEYYKHKEKVALTYFGYKVYNSKLESGYIAGLNFFSGPRYVDVLTGFSGFILHTRMLQDKIYDYSSAPTEARWVDDIWISYWLKYYGIKIKALGFRSHTYPTVNEDLIYSSALNSDKRQYQNTTTIKYFESFMNTSN